MHILRKTDNRSYFKAEYIALLAVLSAEGIVPKLLWTRRVTNGDVISAQNGFGTEVRARGYETRTCCETFEENTLL